MATCAYCKQEMLLGVSCKKFPITRWKIDPLPHTGTENCHDCNCPPGGYHHPGCDWEKCPRCGEQAISCDCNDYEV